MASLTLVIDKRREDVYDLVDLTIREQKVRVTFDIGHCSESGWHVTIGGQTADLKKLEAAFEKKGEIATIHE